MHELQALETITDKLKDILTPEQTARYLIQVEKVSDLNFRLHAPSVRLIASLVQTQIDHEHFQLVGPSQVQLQRQHCKRWDFVGTR
jgi:hypothetical protein